MNSSKMQCLELASPLNIPFNFDCVIISYEEYCISCLISEQITEFIDTSTESLKLVDDATIRLVHEAEVLQSMKQCLLLCFNVISINLAWDLPNVFKHVKFA